MLLTNKNTNKILANIVLTMKIQFTNTTSQNQLYYKENAAFPVRTILMYVQMLPMTFDEEIHTNTFLSEHIRNQFGNVMYYVIHSNRILSRVA